MGRSPALDGSVFHSLEASLSLELRRRSADRSASKHPGRGGELPQCSPTFSAWQSPPRSLLRSAPGPSSHALTPAIIQVSSQSPAAAPPSALLPVSPGGFFPQPLNVCKRLGDMRRDTSSKRLQKLVHAPATKPGPYILSPPCHPGMAPGEWGGLKEAAFASQAWSRTEQTAPHPTSPHLLVRCLGPLPAHTPLLTNSRARRKARGSFSTRKVPAEASCGPRRQERERDSVRKGLETQHPEPGGPAAITRAAQSVLPGSRGP